MENGQLSRLEPPGHVEDALAAWGRAVTILDELGHADAGMVRAKLEKARH